MSVDSVIRSIRFEREFDQRIGRLAAAQGLTVSAFIRRSLIDIAERDDRRRRLEHALQLAAQVPDVELDRDEMWGIGTRVPR